MAKITMIEFSLNDKLYSAHTVQAVMYVQVRGKKSKHQAHTAKQEIDFV